MRSILYTAGCILLLALATHCKQEKEHPCTAKIDTLLYQLDSLSRRISSGEIRRIDDLSYEIRTDLNALDSSAVRPENPPVTQELQDYATLGAYIDSCASSCNAFHQEIVLLESDLLSLKEQITSEEPPDSLEKITSDFQKDIDELALRIDTTLNRSMKLVEQYNLVKPRIENIKQDYIAAGSEPDEAAD